MGYRINRLGSVFKTLIAHAPYLMIFTLFVSTVSSQGEGNISEIWANDGGDKVTQGETRASTNAASVHNSLWNGTTVSVFGAKNEVVNFNLILEAADATASDVTVSFSQLTGPSGFVIQSEAATGNEVFNWTDRDIELFYVDYLEIKGVSRLDYNHYDERHIPEELQRPWTGNGQATGGWNDRPNHNAFYPDIAIPLELIPNFDIVQGENQSIWVDIYIPKNAPGGTYTGTVVVTEGAVQHQVPVTLTVRNFSLPDVPNAKTMLYLGYPDINVRYMGEEYPADEDAVNLIMDRHFMVAHRHRISLIGADDDDVAPPPSTWNARLDGSLFTAANGYDGPGVGAGNNVYSVGTYGVWRWDDEGESAMRQYTNEWVDWFEANSPNTEYFLYLIDESSNYAQIEEWASWINNNPGSGQRLRSLATLTRLHNGVNVPNLDIIAALGRISITDTSQNLANTYTSNPDKRLYFYNGSRPATGTFSMEDDGVALRVTAWSQYKHNIDRWFYWESTYYDNFHAGAGETNVFEVAHTFGPNEGFDSVYGETGKDYSNGAGVLFYPGTDTVFPANSYGVEGPFASLRLKYWRRGIQDVDYLTMAAQIDPDAVEEIVNNIIPKALWEYGVADVSDPTWVYTDISWSTDPDVWEAARAQLAAIIEGAPNDPPLASNDAASVGEDDSAITINVLENDSDPNANTLSISSIDSSGAVGTVVNNGTSIQYNPNGLFNHLAQGTTITDTFSYTISDGSSGAASAEVTVTVTGVNDAPIAVNDSYTTTAGEALSVAAPGVLVNDNEPENESVAAIVIDDVTHGTLNFNEDGSFVYLPGSTFEESDSFTYQANDPLSNSNPATVMIISSIVPTSTPTTIPALTATATATSTPTELPPDNLPPLVISDSFITVLNTSLNIPIPGVLGNDSDPENDPLTAIKTGDPVNGTVVLNNNGSFTYTPNDSFFGGDSFTYKVSDGSTESSNAVVAIWVNNEEPAECPTPPPVHPPFTWTPPGGPADWFNIVLTDAQTNLLLDEWFPVQQVCAGGTCSYMSDVVLPNGEYHWRWRSWANDTFSDWSNENTFEISLPVPQLPTGFTVNTHQGRPSISVPNDPNALWYEIFVGSADGQTLDFNWYPKPKCCGPFCHIHPNAFPTNGNFVAYIRAWGPGGFTTGGQFDGWAGPVDFDISFPAPAAVTRHLISYVNSGTPSFSWQGSAGTTWYWLYVGDVGSGETIHFQGYSALDLGCENASICTAAPDTVFLNNNETYVWYVQGWGPGGYTQGGTIDGWAKGDDFTVNTTSLQEPSPLTPTGSINQSDPTYSWVHTDDISWYQIEIAEEGGENTPLHTNWYSALSLGCFDDGTCQFKSDNLYLPQGSYVWRLQGYNPIWTENSWSEWISFVVTL